MEECPGNATDPRLSFGKYKGKTLSEIVASGDISYVVWLGGYVRQSENFVLRFDDFIKSNWEQRHGACICGKIGSEQGVHANTCYYYGMAATAIHLCYDKMERVILNNEVAFKEASMLRPWLWARKHHPDAVKAATTFLETHRCCWFCGGPLQPVGTARANGKDHADWAGRRLHKKCWTMCVDT